MRRLLWAAAALAITAANAGAHANSVSYAEFSIDDRTVRAIVRLPLDDVDLLLRIDRDLDGRVSDAEFGASRAAIHAYLAKHLHVAMNGAPLAASLARAGAWHDASGFAGFGLLAVGVSGVGHDLQCRRVSDRFFRGLRHRQ